jgi:protein-S-isoprenylcysteine O-methyltransferase Ste14
MEKPTRQRVLLAALLFIILVFAYFDRVNTSVLAADESFLKAMGIKNDPVAIGSMMSMFLVAYAAATLFSVRWRHLRAAHDDDYRRRDHGLAMVIGAWPILRHSAHGPLHSWHRRRPSLSDANEIRQKWFPPHERGKANSAWQVGR